LLSCGIEHPVRYPDALRGAKSPGYQRCRPDAAARSASGRGYPRFVVEEFDKYERCGIFAYGVVRVY
jgi:hypothetical protein